jgi:rubredoxin
MGAHQQYNLRNWRCPNCGWVSSDDVSSNQRCRMCSAAVSWDKFEANAEPAPAPVSVARREFLLFSLCFPQKFCSSFRR